MTTAREAPEETLSRREREKAAHRQEILEAAMNVFARKGFAAATIDEIAQEAEFSKGAVYLYFSSKEELLSTILIDMIENTISADIRTILVGAGSLRKELTEVFQAAAEFAFSHRLHMSASMPLHLSQFSGLSEETREKISACQQQMLQILQARVAKARTDGELRAISIEAVVGLIHGALDSMAMTRWGCETIEELKKAVDEIIEIIFGGIQQRKE